MAGFSTYLAAKIIDATLRKSAYSTPANAYLALFSADPTDENVTTNEVAGAWYGRVNAGAWSDPQLTGSSANSDTLIYNAVTGVPVTVSHWGIYDAETSGYLLYSGEFSSPRTLNVGDVATLAPGDLNISLL
jgi:hypothetical protein